ncbi:unnamed protein product [Penicillium salamii]|uniref:BTB domain-containing protein n=1 Tax=Penicillium salamii TaxID=1612424 RepID=A0A9W4K566_9EURO|nr:unnamed protein product [Penicillium salamii]CAG8241049.1 unnamed protein product [Penicillium salamii]CAG8294455.1 unnamed protein product [Penicillium salamii]CAG8325452.1 unnamed protein product [Penicillium salamii]CAG8335203.1 unnamed protein product [Penicillium salamii]
MSFKDIDLSLLSHIIQSLSGISWNLIQHSLREHPSLQLSILPALMSPRSLLSIYLATHPLYFTFTHYTSSPNGGNQSKRFRQRVSNSTSNKTKAHLCSVLSSPRVTIRISNGIQEYKVSRELLCEQSPYFAAMFQGKFREAKDQSVTLQAMEGVISEQSFEGLVQWICIKRVTFDLASPSDQITAFIELARLADMCGMVEMQEYLASSVNGILKKGYYDSNPEAPRSLSKHLTTQHICSATALPEGHPLFRVLCVASVRDILEKKCSRLVEATRSNHRYAAGVLQEVIASLDGMTLSLTQDSSAKHMTAVCYGRDFICGTQISIATTKKRIQ